MTKRLSILLVAAAFGAAMLSTMETQAQEKAKEKTKVKEKKVGDAVLKYEDLKEGERGEAKKDDIVQVHYTGWLTNGKKFDSSVVARSRLSSSSVPAMSLKVGTRASPA